jgi:predicted NUDIX family NTP pyrophosphohydrolase
MTRTSAGILLYRFANKTLEVLLVHPGGPFWKNKDAGVWSIPKGEFTDGEDALVAAKREFGEELGQPLPEGKTTPLHKVKQNAGKTVVAWAVEGTIDATHVNSNTFRMEFPPKSGKWIDVPEVDKAAWFTLDEALQKILPGQKPLLIELSESIGNADLRN